MAGEAGSDVPGDHWGLRGPGGRTLHKVEGVGPTADGQIFMS